MDKDNFRACARAELEKMPIDAPLLSTKDFVAHMCERHEWMTPIECLLALERCKDMCSTEPELKTRGPNKGKIVNARRWGHPSRLPEREAPINAVAKLRELEARIARLEQLLLSNTVG